MIDTTIVLALAVGTGDVLSVIRNIAQSLNNLASSIGQVFPSSAGTISPTATAGTSGALPAEVTGYLNVQIGGVSYKIPVYKP